MWFDPRESSTDSNPRVPSKSDTDWFTDSSSDRRSGQEARHLVVVAATLVALSSGGITAASAAPWGSNLTYATNPQQQRRHEPVTPNECILLNGGDHNACNVDNSGRGDLPYLPAPAY
jgi:hypothetical protein